MLNQSNLILKIIELKQKLDELRPISSENLLNIRQKFQLEFNYHSNHIEGNSLTYQETYTMLMNSYSPRESKSLRDIDELRGHIKTVNTLGLLEDVVKDKKEITEVLIRDLNKMILVENYKKRREDELGNETWAEVIVGQYKTKPNSVMTQTGEMFRFADPAETPALMNDLIDWYNKSKELLHPLELAAIFHYKFIRIHPFDDGNGRVARLLMNLMLQNNGYPIVIIPSDEKSKEEYYRALMQTDANVIDLYSAISGNDVLIYMPFIDYIGQRLTISLDWMIRGAKGEDISDIGDIVKEARLWGEVKSKHNGIQNGLSLIDLIHSGNYVKFEEFTLKPILHIIDQVIINFTKPFYHDVNVSFWTDHLELSSDFISKYKLTNLEFDLNNKEILTDPSILFKLQMIFLNLKKDGLKQGNESTWFGIKLNFINSYEPPMNMDYKAIPDITIFFYPANMSWNFCFITVDTLEILDDSSILYYKITPNEDYKEAIKEPLKTLSKYLKEKLN